MLASLSLVSADTNDDDSNIASASHKDPGYKPQINLMPALTQLGYNPINYTLAPEEIIYQLLQIPTALTLNLDGTFSATPILNASQVAILSDYNQLLTSTNSETYLTPPQRSTQFTFQNPSPLSPANLDNIKPLEVRNNTLPVDLNPSKNQEIPLTLDTFASKSGLRACLIVAVSDYQGTGNDLTDYWGPQILDCLTENATGYDTVVILSDSDATKGNIISALQTLDSEYVDVDVYFSGHGGVAWPNQCYYCTYDSIGPNNESYYWNGIYSGDFKIFYPYPYQIQRFPHVRLGVGAFCYGNGIKDGFIYGKTYCAYMGPNSVSNTGISRYFYTKFLYDWCQLGYSSYYAYSEGFDYAQSQLREGEVNLEYDDLGSTIYHDYIYHQNYAADVYDCGTLSGNGWCSNGPGLEGAQNNDIYCQLYAGNYGDASYVKATMNSQAYGDIVVYGYGDTGYYWSDLYCWVSDNGYDWYETPNYPVEINYWDGTHYIDFGQSPIAFTYIAIVGYDDYGYSVSVHLDAIHVFW